MNHVALAFALFALSTPLMAKIPDIYQPFVVTAKLSFSERRFDLTEAVKHARATGKPLLIYVGAEDCPPCKQFSTFLIENVASLKDPIANVVVVDIRTWLRGPKIVFAIGSREFSTAEFKAMTGDSRQEFTFPYFWFVDSELRQVKQLPVGSSNYMSVDRLRELIVVPVSGKR
jgi:thioredoxin-related protein